MLGIVKKVVVMMVMNVIVTIYGSQHGIRRSDDS